MIKNDSSEKKIATNYIRCGDCLYYKRKHPDFDQPCNVAGILPRAIAPAACFTPDVTPLKKGGSHFLHTLGLMTGNMKPAQIRALANLFSREPRLKKTGFALFEKVFFYVSNPNYLSNYYSGHVLSIGSSADQLIVCGELLPSTPVVTAHLLLDHVMSAKDFLVKRDLLIAKQKLYDPNFTRSRPKIKVAALKDYEPPTFDMTLEELETAAKAASKVKPAKGKAPKKRGTRVLSVDS